MVIVALGMKVLSTLQSEMETVRGTETLRVSKVTESLGFLCTPNTVLILGLHEAQHISPE